MAGQTGSLVERAPAVVTLARALLTRSPQRALALTQEVAGVAGLPADLRFDALQVGAAARLMMSDFGGATADLERLSGLAASGGERARVATLVAIRAQRSGDLTGALNHILEALRLWEGADDAASPLSASTHNVAGNLFAQFGDFSGAIEQFQHALSRVGHDVDDDVTAVVANNLGRAYRELGQHAEAEDAFRGALARFADADASVVRCGLLCNLGTTLVEAGRATEALAVLELALDRSTASGLGRLSAAALHALGLALQADGRLDEARARLEDALALRRQMGERVDVAETQVRLASVLHGLGRDAEAEALLVGVAEGPQATEWLSARTDALHLLYRICRERGDLARALDYHVAYVEQRRVYTDERSTLRYQVLHARFRNEQLAREREAERARGAVFEALAHTDPLTGLPNRRYVDGHLDALLAAELGALTVGLLDIDHFKRINDDHGHEVGDTVLRAVAQTLGSKLREGDIVARYGGEEFLLVFRDASVAQAEEACLRLLDALRRFDWASLRLPTGVTASIGLADRRGGVRRAALIAEADRALYRAKAQGRDQVQRS